MESKILIGAFSPHCASYFHGNKRAISHHVLSRRTPWRQLPQEPHPTNLRKCLSAPILPQLRPSTTFSADDMSSPHLRPQLRPSLSSRLSLAISTRSAEAEEEGHPQEHIEEIDEIRRYEVSAPLLELGMRGVELN